jgi:hypothetical protein
MNLTIGDQTFFIPRSATLQEIAWVVLRVQFLAAATDPRRI